MINKLHTGTADKQLKMFINTNANYQTRSEGWVILAKNVII